MVPSSHSLSLSLSSSFLLHSLSYWQSNTHTQPRSHSVKLIFPSNWKKKLFSFLHRTNSAGPHRNRTKPENIMASTRRCIVAYFFCSCCYCMANITALHARKSKHLLQIWHTHLLLCAVLYCIRYEAEISRTGRMWVEMRFL